MARGYIERFNRLSIPQLSDGTHERALLLIRWRLGIRIVWIGLVSFMVDDHAASRGTQLPVSCHVTGDTTYNGALNASLGVCERGPNQSRHRLLAPR
jgi:hypothetical protein